MLRSVFGGDAGGEALAIVGVADRPGKADALFASSTFDLEACARRCARCRVPELALFGEREERIVASTGADGVVVVDWL